MAGIGYTRAIPSSAVTKGLRMTPYDPVTGGETGRRPTAAELFAGVGGFHLALDRAGFDVVWSNQWEPATKAQHAFDCYVRHVARRRLPDVRARRARGRSAAPTDLGLDRSRRGQRGHRQGPRPVRGRAEAVEAPGRSQSVPDVDLLVGGFPCQDYSVARTLRQAHGLVGKKGVLWWEIHRLLRLKLRAVARSATSSSRTSID